MRFPRLKHVGKGVFKPKHLPRCKCGVQAGKPGGVCRACGLAVLTHKEIEAYSNAYPTTGRALGE